jgi:anti-sigma factor RsiW
VTDAGPVPHLGDALSGLLDGELEPAEAAAARAHLAACPGCAAELRGVGAARGWVRSLPPVEPRAGFDAALLRPGRWWMFERTASRRLAAAGVAAGIALAVAVAGTGPSPEPPVAPAVADLVESHLTGSSLDGDPVSQLVPVGVPVPFR